MRKLLALAAVMAIATPAYAGLGVDARFDYFSGTSNSTTSSQNTSLSGFLWDWLRVSGDGKVADGVTFKARINPMAFSATGTANDTTASNSVSKLKNVNPAITGLVVGGLPSTGVTDIVDYAEVQTKVADMVTIHAGKLASNYLSGFEAQTAPADMYFASQGNLYQLYMTGVAGEYKLADNQNLSLVIANNPSFVAVNTASNLGGTAGDNTRMALGLQYMGTFGNFGVIASYHQLPYGTNAAGNAVTTTPLTVGLSYKMDDWKFTLDYDSLVTTNAAKSGNNTTQNSIVGTARYDMGSWSPWVKIESTSQQGFETVGTTDTTNNIMNWSLAAEYKKNAADPFRYEIAYVSAATTYATGQATNTSVTGTYAFLGLRYMGDFLK